MRKLRIKDTVTKSSKTMSTPLIIFRYEYGLGVKVWKENTGQQCLGLARSLCEG
jgi:hypothetical protein